VEKSPVINACVVAGEKERNSFASLLADRSHDALPLAPARSLKQVHGFPTAKNSWGQERLSDWKKCSPPLVL